MLAYSAFVYCRYEHVLTHYSWQWNFIFSADHYDLQMHSLHEHMLHPFFLKSAYQYDKSYWQNCIKPGDSIAVPTIFLAKFFDEILPYITIPFVLISNSGDDSPVAILGQRAELLLNDQRLIHWFAENNDFEKSHKKLSLIPIGVDYHTLFLRPHGAYGEAHKNPLVQESLLHEILQHAQPTHKRISKIYADFHLNDNLGKGVNQLFKRVGYTRTSLKEQLNNKIFVHFQESNLPRTKVWQEKINYAFSISPHGNGLDCLRTWEDLILGCIVIVKTSTLDPLYEGLPVVIVHDWSEITEENLNKWLERYGDAFTNTTYREKLTSQYWLTQIKVKQQEWRRQQEE